MKFSACSGSRRRYREYRRRPVSVFRPECLEISKRISKSAKTRGGKRIRLVYFEITDTSRSMSLRQRAVPSGKSWPASCHRSSYGNVSARYFRREFSRRKVWFQSVIWNEGNRSTELFSRGCLSRENSQYVVIVWGRRGKKKEKHGGEEKGGKKGGKALESRPVRGSTSFQSETRRALIEDI